MEVEAVSVIVPSSESSDNASGKFDPGIAGFDLLESIRGLRQDVVMYPTRSLESILAWVLEQT
jgi:hypothetical protein